MSLRLEFPNAPHIKTIIVREKYIFLAPDNATDNPVIFWVWNRRLQSGNTFHSGPTDLVTMNLRMLKKMHDCQEDIVGASLFMSAVLVEELTHCATRSMKNHKNWITMLEALQTELHGSI